MTCITWNDAHSLSSNIQWIKVPLRIKWIPPIVFLETSLPFPTAKVPLHGARRNPVPEAGTRQSHRLPGDRSGQYTLIHLLDQGSISSNEDGSQIKSAYHFLCLHKISSPFLIFSFRWLHTKLSLALKSLRTFASLGGIHGAPGSRGKQRSRSQPGQGTLQDQTFRNPIHWIDAVADTMLGTHVKIEMLLKMFNLVRQISKNLCKTI